MVAGDMYGVKYDINNHVGTGFRLVGYAVELARARSLLSLGRLGLLESRVVKYPEVSFAITELLLR